MKSPLFLALFGAVSHSACAQSATNADKVAAPAGSVAATGADAVVRKALKGFNPQVDIDYIGAAPFAGFREVIAGGQVIYVSDDGKYLIVGNAMDIAKRTSVSENSPALTRLNQLWPLPVRR